VVSELANLPDLAQAAARLLTEAQNSQLSTKPQLFQSRLAPCDISNFLLAQPCQPLFYFFHRNGEEEALALGYAQSWHLEDARDTQTTLRAIETFLNSSSSPLRLYGGLAFGARPALAAEWEPFGRLHFFLPRWEIRRQDKLYYLRLVADHGFDATQAYNCLKPLLTTLSAPSPRRDFKVKRRWSLPDYEAWHAIIDQALSDITAQRYEKVVLARRVTYELDIPPIPAWLFSAIDLPSAPGRYVLYFQPTAGTAFLSLTPERLYQRKQKYFQSEALAGTRPRGRNSTEDERLAQELLATDKERREHAVVGREIVSRLVDITERLEPQAVPEIIKLPHVQHLRIRIEGQLKEEVSDKDLLAALHPTPAVGGFPRRAALAAIQRWEPFSRGWYAAPMGWLERDAAEFTVAIRSLLVSENRLHLYAGAGIVAGSQPQKEWREIESKLKNFTVLLD